MMNNLLFLLREDRFKSVKEVSSGLVSHPTYKKLEQNLGDAKFDILIDILNNLDVSYNEFSYIYQKKGYHITGSRDNNINLIRSLKSSINTDDLFKAIKSYNNEESIYYHTLKAIYNIHIDDLKQAKFHGEKVWDKLKSFDTLYAYDLFCLTHIFMVFDFDNLKFISEQIKKNLVFWRDFENFSSVEITFYMNLGRYLEELGEKKLAIDNYTTALDLSKRNDSAIYSSVNMMRLGHLTNDDNLLKNGSDILKTFDLHTYHAIYKDITR